LILLVIVLAIALWQIVLSFALTSASFGIAGAYNRGGSGARLVSCSLDKTLITMPKPASGSEIQTQTATLLCVNNLPVGTTLNVSLSGIGISPSIPQGDFFNWNYSGTALSIPGKGQGSVVFTFNRKKQDTARVYTVSFNVSAGTTPQAMGYTPPQYTITVDVK
jgi:hypothetical protein